MIFQAMLHQAFSWHSCLTGHHQLEVSPRRVVQYLVEHVDPKQSAHAQRNNFQTVHSDWYWAWKAGQYLLLVSTTLRMWLLCAVMHHTTPTHPMMDSRVVEPYLGWEPFLGSFWLQLNLTSEWILVASISLSPLYVILADWTLYHGMDHRRLALIWDIIQRAKVLRTNIKAKSFASTAVSDHQLATFEAMADRVVVIIATGAFFIFGLVSLIYLWQTLWHSCLLQSHPPLTQARFLIELVIAWFLVWNGFRTTLCLLYGLGLLSTAYHAQLSLLQSRLNRTPNRMPGLRWVWSAALARYRRQWVSTIDFSVWLNRHAIRPVLTVVMAIGLPINVVMIVTLVHRSQHLLWAEVIFILLTVIVQSSLLPLMCSLCIWLSDSLYGGGCSWVLYRLQPKVGTVRTRVAVMMAHECVCTRNRFHFTLGPCGKVTKRSMYEFLYIYSASLMYVFERFQKETLVRINSNY